MNDKQLAMLTEDWARKAQEILDRPQRPPMPWTREEAMAFVFLPSALTALADARLEVANGQEDGTGWSWRIRNTERGLVLERLQHGRRPFWEEVSLLAAYLPSAQDARSVRFRALLARAEKAEAEVVRLNTASD